MLQFASPYAFFLLVPVGIVVGALGMTAGFCGTLVTPMAANFNVVPANLLELPDRKAALNGVIRAQIPTALPLLIANIILMRLLALNGEVTAVLTQYRQLERMLAQELGSAPEAATTALFTSAALASATSPSPMTTTAAATGPVATTRAARGSPPRRR